MLKKLIAGIATLALALGMVALTTGPASASPDPKVVVCKYVGTPGVDETAGPTITVSSNTLKDWDGSTFPFAFTDAQGKSVAIGFEGTTATCPAPEGAPTPPVVDPIPDPKKVVVCKYVGTPGVDETAGPTITVSINTLQDWDGSTFPFAFTDAQGRSVAIGFEGDVTGDDCPDPEFNVVKVVGDPLFHNAFCQLDGNFPVAGTFEVVAALHVNYTVSINDGAEVAIAVGTHSANPGDHVEIWAHADAGWVLDEELQSYWEHTFGPAVDCSLTPPSLSCLLFDEEGGITLPLIAHVKWIVDAAPAASGPIPVQLSILDTHIQAVADTGYVFSAGTTSWAFGLDENGVCSLPTFAEIPTNVTHTDQVCRSGVAGGGTVTVGQVQGESFFDETNYFLDGSVTPMAAATVAVGAGGHTVTAALKDLDDTFVEGSETSWSFTVLAPASCGDLTTLALTGGGSNPAGWAGLGYYLLVAGLALVAVRTLRRRNEVKQ